jgi:hypothetical protein
MTPPGGDKAIMTEPGNTSVPSLAMEAPPAHAERGPDTSKTNAASRGLRLIQRLLTINLGLVGLQAVSAGFLLSGYERAVTVHGVVAVALQLCAVIQAVSAIVLWRRRRVPAWVAGISIGLLVIVFLQIGLGYSKRYWLHVPIGVAMVGGLTRQANRLDALSRALGARS